MADFSMENLLSKTIDKLENFYTENRNDKKIIEDLELKVDSLNDQINNLNTELYKLKVENENFKVTINYIIPLTLIMVYVYYFKM